MRKFANIRLVSQDYRKKKLKFFRPESDKSSQEHHGDRMKVKSLKSQEILWNQLSEFADLDPQSNWQSKAQEAQIPLPLARTLMVSIQEAKLELIRQTGHDDEIFQVWDWSNWCRMTHLLETMASDNLNASLKAIIIPLLKEQRLHPAYPVYLQLRQKWQECEQEDVSLGGDLGDLFGQHKIHVIEECLLDRSTILIETPTKKIMNLIPCKLAFLEGELALVAEETHDHGLIALPLSEIINIKKSDKIKTARAGSHEVTEFISALREMSDNETRLVLKIKDPQNNKILPDYHFLGKPYLVTNPDGDLIWAAWVEPSNELFDWLYEMRHKVEILEPGELVLDFAAFCEEKERKIA